MRRFIDVVFVEPKNKHYVVLHQGQFWQLPRLNLTKSAWSFKTPYQGSLNDIFIAKDQALACQELTQILKTYDLPEQLHGMNAHWFLDWWEMYDYKWLSTKDVITLDSSQANTTTNRPSVNIPSTIDGNKTVMSEPSKAPTATQTMASHTKSQSTPSNQITPQDKPSSQVKTDLDASIRPSTTTNTDKDSIFDQLTQELNYDISHQ